jgi:asparagine synthase (glutamine-hydrolysing)
VSKHAYELGIKVWLTGVGGDELIGGYSFFRRIPYLRLLSRILHIGGVSAITNLVSKLLPQHLKIARLAHLGHAGDTATRAHQAARTHLPCRNALAVQSSIFDDSESSILSLLDEFYPDTQHFTDDFQRATALESMMYMGPQLLRDIDNFSMAHSIEARAPFLDHNLFTYVLSLPQHYKQRGNRTKPLLCEALQLPLPEPIKKLPKRGFTFPMETWLKDHMRSSFRDYVLCDRNRAYWNLDTLRGLWESYLKGNLHWSVVWGFYAQARWLQSHSDHV